MTKTSFRPRAGLIAAVLFAAISDLAAAQNAAPSARYKPIPEPIVDASAPVDPAPVSAAEAQVAPPKPVPAWLRNNGVVAGPNLFVLNAVSLPLTCRINGPGETQASFVIGGGEQMSRRVPFRQSDSYTINCGRPADGRTYRLRGGTRNVYLLDKETGIAALRAVDFGPRN